MTTTSGDFGELWEQKQYTLQITQDQKSNGTGKNFVTAKKEITKQQNQTYSNYISYKMKNNML